MATKPKTKNAKLDAIKAEIAQDTVCRYKADELTKAAFHFLDAEFDAEGKFGDCIRFTVQPEGKSKGILTLPDHEKRRKYVELFAACESNDEKAELSKELGKFVTKSIAPKRAGFNPAWVFSKVTADDNPF